MFNVYKESDVNVSLSAELIFVHFSTLPLSSYGILFVSFGQYLCTSPLLFHYYLTELFVTFGQHLCTSPLLFHYHLTEFCLCHLDNICALLRSCSIIILRNCVCGIWTAFVHFFALVPLSSYGIVFVSFGQYLRTFPLLFHYHLTELCLCHSDNICALFRSYSIIILRNCVCVDTSRNPVKPAVVLVCSVRRMLLCVSIPFSRTWILQAEQVVDGKWNE